MAQTAAQSELSIIIRPLNIEDENEMTRVLDIAESFHAESEFSYHPFSRQKVERLLQSLSKQQSGYVRIAEIDGMIEGGMVCLINEPYYSEAAIVQDMGLFINPSKRGNRVAAMLVEDMIKWSIQNNASEVWLGVTAGIENEAAGKLYEHFGFEGRGTVYRKVL